MIRWAKAGALAGLMVLAGCATASPPAQVATAPQAAVATVACTVQAGANDATALGKGVVGINIPLFGLPLGAFVIPIVPVVGIAIEIVGSAISIIFGHSCAMPAPAT